ncbi:glycosyltransferase family 4 protein [Niveibacterium terrae]|uniref:glycosyltransferase family 4 protein n=1 Tax=Niveibacterium terrae TaxID=3373598 RepID=UPI003A936BFD
MRILVLTKRQYTGRDLLSDRYGRMFEIPAQLSALGHQVAGVALSYRSRGKVLPDATGGSVLWRSIDLFPGGLWRYPRQLRQTVAQFRPDVIWASSDVLHALAGLAVKRVLGVPVVIDLYDNYESFGLSQIPGAVGLLRAACRNADGLTLVGANLLGYAERNYRLPPGLPRLVLGNAVDDSLFRPIPKLLARERLGVDSEATLIGTAGALSVSRGFPVVLEAYGVLAQSMPSVQLLLAGPRDRQLDGLDHPGVRYLGILEPERVPFFWSALDVAIVPNIDTPFGRYCYPQKLQEVLACETPFVASAVGEVRLLLSAFPEFLATAGSVSAMVQRLAGQLDKRCVLPRSFVSSWRGRALELEAFLSEVVSRSAAGAGSLSH